MFLVVELALCCIEGFGRELHDGWGEKLRSKVPMFLFIAYIYLCDKKTHERPLFFDICKD